MKKFLAISFACLYIAVTSGLVLQVHYCMGKLAGTSVTLADNDDHACSKCGMEKQKNKCCHDEVNFLKLQDAHKPISFGYDIQAPVVATQQEWSPIQIGQLPVVECGSINNHSPPEAYGQPAIYLLHCVFRI